MFGIGVQEMAFLAVIALLVFGPKRLPELARTLGKGMAEFRRASADLRGALSLEPDAHPSNTPPSTRKKQGGEVDPREDRDFSGVPDQAIGGPDLSSAPDAGQQKESDTEAANQALLEDESNDTRHDDAEASTEKPTEAKEQAETAADDAVAATRERTD